MTTQLLRPNMVGSVIEIKLAEYEEEVLVGRLAGYKTDHDYVNIYFENMMGATKVRSSRVQDVVVWDVPREVITRTSERYL